MARRQPAGERQAPIPGDPRSVTSMVEYRDKDKPFSSSRGLHTGRPHSTYSPYQDAVYYRDDYKREPIRRHDTVAQRKPQRRYYDSEDSDWSDSEDEYYRRIKSRGRGHSRSRRSLSSSRSRSRSRRRHSTDLTKNRPKESYTALKALKSAAMAGGVEAVRCRAEGGDWTGQKGTRVAISAATGAAIGSLRNGRLQNSGKLPYAEAAMTGFYAIDFLKRVCRHTEFNKEAEKEKKEWEKHSGSEDEGRERRRSHSRRRRSRS